MELSELLQTTLALLGLGMTMLGLQMLKSHLRHFIRR